MRWEKRAKTGVKFAYQQAFARFFLSDKYPMFLVWQYMVKKMHFSEQLQYKMDNLPSPFMKVGRLDCADYLLLCCYVNHYILILLRVQSSNDYIRYK